MAADTSTGGIMSDLSSSCIDINERDWVLELIINRPDRKNALTLAMYETLAKTIRDATDNARVRVILIRGSEACFTSGNDLTDFMNDPPKDESSPVVQFMQALVQTPKPVVAAVEGPAVGIGTTLLLHCDLVYAAPSAALQMPFTKLGLTPEFASSLLLPQLMGHAKAAELLMLGETIGAEKASALGLVTDVVEKSGVGFYEFVRGRCVELARQPPSAVRCTKMLMKENMLGQIEAMMKTEMHQFTKGLASAEFREAVTAFFEKREPDFSEFE